MSESESRREITKEDVKDYVERNMGWSAYDIVTYLGIKKQKWIAEEKQLLSKESDESKEILDDYLIKTRNRILATFLGEKMGWKIEKIKELFPVFLDELFREENKKEKKKKGQALKRLKFWTPQNPTGIDTILTMAARQTERPKREANLLHTKAVILGCKEDPFEMYGFWRNKAYTEFVTNRQKENIVHTCVAFPNEGIGSKLKYRIENTGWLSEDGREYIIPLDMRISKGDGNNPDYFGKFTPTQHKQKKGWLPVRQWTRHVVLIDYSDVDNPIPRTLNIRGAPSDPNDKKNFIEHLKLQDMRKKIFSVTVTKRGQELTTYKNSFQEIDANFDISYKKIEEILQNPTFHFRPASDKEIEVENKETGEKTKKKIGLIPRFVKFRKAEQYEKANVITREPRMKKHDWNLWLASKVNVTFMNISQKDDYKSKVIIGISDMIDKTYKQEVIISIHEDLVDFGPEAELILIYTPWIGNKDTFGINYIGHITNLEWEFDPYDVDEERKKQEQEQEQQKTDDEPLVEPTKKDEQSLVDQDTKFEDFDGAGEINLGDVFGLGGDE